MSFYLSLSFSHSFFSIGQPKPLSLRLWTRLQHHWRSCWKHTELNTHLYEAGGWAHSSSKSSSVQPGIGHSRDREWWMEADRSTAPSLSWGLSTGVPPGCSATAVHKALGELFLPARSLPAEPCWVLSRASHVTLESAYQSSPCSQHFMPHTSLQDVSYSFVTGGRCSCITSRDCLPEAMGQSRGKS